MTTEKPIPTIGEMEKPDEVIDWPTVLAAAGEK